MIKAQFMTYAATNNVTKKPFFSRAFLKNCTFFALSCGRPGSYHLADYIMSHEVTVSEE